MNIVGLPVGGMGRVIMPLRHVGPNTAKNSQTMDAS
jgi:hypothetical protein